MQEVREGEGEEQEKEVWCNVRCPKSHPGPSHSLSVRISDISRSCWCDKYGNWYYYHCTTCNVDFDLGCPHFPPKKITHPYHLQHPLTYTRLNTQYAINNVVQTQSPFIFDRCGWCGKNPTHAWVYSCSICSFCLCFPCSEKTPLLTIPNPKSHHHPLSFFPRPLLVPCDACGLVNASETSYACFQCNYMVHESCMDLPRIIKLTRHPHRLFLTPCFWPETVWCRVCYKLVDTRYGQYSCNHDDCSYVIHSRCAIHEEVWDGRELEWEPEDCDEETEDVASFIKVGDGLIKYFSHDHHLKLEKYYGFRDANKQCEACVLPIDSRCFYSCTQCDYFLHEVCAGLPRKLDHEIHKHSLFLDPTSQNDYYKMNCSTCYRSSNGFKYMCVEEDCVRLGYSIDVQCILIPHYFTHKSHEHPLFSSVSNGWYKCRICNQGNKRARLCCTLCEFSMCYECATIPSEMIYKYDEHPLFLCCGETEDVGIYWCEVCEEKINSKDWFYTCNKCCVTIHIECIFKSSVANLKSGTTFSYKYYKVEVKSNNSNTRLICAICEKRCTYSICYTLLYQDGWFDKPLCSFSCLKTAMYKIFPDNGWY